MKAKIILNIFFIVPLFLSSCDSGCSTDSNGGVVYYVVADTKDEEGKRNENQCDDSFDVFDNSYNEREIIVPFRNKNGVKYIDVKVNGVGFEMIFDTGCSDALISVAEAQYLYNKGKLGDEDFLGFAPTQIANGSIVVDMVVNLKEVIIGDEISCYNIKASVSDNVKAPLLLGNGVLDQIDTYSVDNESKTIRFKLKSNEL